MQTILGQCFCGKVHYEVRPPLKFLVHDHCSMCRRISGAAFVTWGGIRVENFKILAGEEDLTRFHSSAEAVRQFCRHCGSHLFFSSQRWPGEIHFTLATVTTPLDMSPQAHVYFKDRVDWISIQDDLPKKG